MSSSKLMLIFLGIIFLIIVMLSSGRISGFLRTRFGKFIPSSKKASSQITTTPALSPAADKPTSTPSPVSAYKPSANQKGTPPASSEIPATGPNDFVWIAIGTSLLAGVFIRKATSFPKDIKPS